ncbi:hypothetical protein OpiT1DRAFT_00724 [Opitutaceae bacterium TAV1]|nr:hypothetical protein OpiT1DRAFT_00724 [Opitutaceae bacterium TAV1]
MRIPLIMLNFCSIPVRLFLFLAATCCLSLPAQIKPIDTETFFITPDAPSTLRWRMENAVTNKTLSYSITDYSGNPVTSFTSAPAVIKGDTVEVTLALPPGYYELTFEASPSLACGIVSIPAFDRARLDPFFCIDSALSWLERSEARRTSLIRMMHRSGIALSRERFSWQRISPSRGKWNWEGAAQRQYDRLRETYVREGVPLLDMFHDSPLWMERPGSYPVELLTATDDLATIARRWGANWNALELWNETDSAAFAGNRAMDQYLPFVHAVAWTWTRNNFSSRLGSAVFAGFYQLIADNATRNGIFDSSDFISFHIYGPPDSIGDTVKKVRNWAASAGRPHVPLWVTETGSPWTDGTDRAPLREDQGSALNITAKVIEGRALGIMRLFPFVMPYYRETGKNYGMVGKDGTALRSFAAYAWSITALANKDYIGDLILPSGSAVKLSRLFAAPDSDEIIAVLYTGKSARAGASVALHDNIPLSAIRDIRGLDGRHLTAASSRAIPVPDGLTWLTFDRAALRQSGAIKAQTPAMSFYELAQKPDPGRLPPSPVVLQFVPDPSRIMQASEMSILNLGAITDVPLDFRAVNLDPDHAQTITMRLHVGPRGRASTPLGEPKTLTLAPRSQQAINWRVNPGNALRDTNVMTIRATATYDPASPAAATTRVPPLSIDFLTEKTLPQLLELYGKKVRLPITDLSLWNKNYINEGKEGKLGITAKGKEYVRLDVRFGKDGTEWDYWVYPRFTFPKETDIRGAEGMTIRARATHPSAIRAFVWKTSESGYFTRNPVIPADGEWHACFIPFASMPRQFNSKPDPDGNLVDHLHNVKQIAIGMNMQLRVNTLDVSDVIIVWPKK